MENSFDMRPLARPWECYSSLARGLHKSLGKTGGLTLRSILHLGSPKVDRSAGAR